MTKVKLEQIVLDQIDTIKITSSKDAIKIFRDEIGKSDREQFAVLCLNTKNNPTAFQVVHTGALNIMVVHPREVFKVAVQSNANSIILGHNHPSGDLKEPESDIERTVQLVKAGEILGIEVLDHIIVSNKKGKSMREENNEWFINEKS